MLFLLTLGFVLGGCQASAKVDQIQIRKAETWVAGATWLYVRGNLTAYSPNPNWAVSDTFKMTTGTYVNSAGTTVNYYYFKGLQLNVNDEFKLACTDWGTNDMGATYLTDISKYYMSGTNNIVCTVAGTYDVYLTCGYQNTSNYKVSVVKTAKDLLLKQDKEYTRTTTINLSADGLTTVQQNNYFNSITKNRVTYFVDGGLYMREVGGTGTNSGYYTKQSEPNSMYHFTLSGGSDTFNSSSATMANVRRDSTIKNVNDFFCGCHYFHDNAVTVGDLFTFDIDNNNYYATAAVAGDQVTNFSYLTAPLFTNSVNSNVTFNGIGLKDLGPTQTNFYNYVSPTGDTHSIMASDANTIFSVAEITNIGATSASIPWMAGYITG
jgi:hypothetical protein